MSGSLLSFLPILVEQVPDPARLAVLSVPSLQKELLPLPLSLHWDSFQIHSTSQLSQSGQGLGTLHAQGSGWQLPGPLLLLCRRQQLASESSS